MRHTVLMLALLTLAACATAPPVARNNAYFLDGINRSDGMTAVISREHSYLLLVDLVYPISYCNDALLVDCFSTTYMTFAFPTTTVDTWQSNGFEFKKIASRHLSGKNINDRVDVIESMQTAGTFFFYYSTTFGLVGWDLMYSSPEGTPRSYRYFLDELKLGNEISGASAPQPNYSFQGKTTAMGARVHLRFFTRAPIAAFSPKFWR